MAGNKIVTKSQKGKDNQKQNLLLVLEGSLQPTD